MASCEVRRPVVTDKDGNEITAPLYTELTKMVGVLDARKMYNDIISDDFKNQSFYKDIVNEGLIDEYGQPTIEGLLKYTDFRRVVDTIKFGESVKDDLFGNKIDIKDTASFISALAKVRDWNKKSTYYKALLTKEPNGDFGLQVTPSTIGILITVDEVDKYLENIKAINNPAFYSLYISNYTINNTNSTLNPNSIIDNLVDFKGKKSTFEDFLSVFKGMSEYKDALGLRASNIILQDVDFMIDYITRNGLSQMDTTRLRESVTANPKTYAGIVKNHILYQVYKDRTIGDIIIGNNKMEHAKTLIERLGNKLSKSIEALEIPQVANDDDKLFSGKNPQFLGNTDYFVANHKKNIEDEKDVLKRLYYFESGIRNKMKKMFKKKELKELTKGLAIIENAIESGEAYLGLQKYIANCIDCLKELQKKNLSDLPLNIRAKNIKILIDKCNEYNNILEYFNDYINDNMLKTDLEAYLNDILKKADISKTVDQLTKEEMETYLQNEKLEPYKTVFEKYFDNSFELDGLNSFTVMVSRFLTDLKKQAVDLTAEFLQQYQTEEGSIVKWGKNKGKEIDIKELLKKADSDVNIYNKLFSAMADCPDQIFRLTDKATKTEKGKARLEVQDLAREIKKEALILEKSGIKDFSWMYNRKSDGSKTGSYITKFNNPEAYKRIMSDSRKKRFYEFFMETKNTLDMAYPESMTPPLEKIIGIRKDRLERLKNVKDLKQAKNEIIEGVKDNYIDRNDDEDIAGYSELFVDASGNEFKMLPVYYNNYKEEDADQMSEDAVSTLIAYSAKAIEYKHLNNLIDLIEVEKIALKERMMPSYDGMTKVLNMFNRVFYKHDKSEIENSVVYHKDEGTSNAYKMFDSWVDMQFYGRFRQKEGNIGNTNISAAKVVDMLNKKTATAALSLNTLNGISNVITGVSQTRIETIVGSIGEGYVGVKDMAKADLIYSKEVMSYLNELGNRVKTSKLALFSEMLNVSQEYENDITETEWHRNTWAKRLMTSGALGFLQKSGEHYMSHRMALAIAIHTKLKDKNGNERTLWEALKREFIQEDGTYGSEDKGLGARLTLDGEYTLNGKEFKFEGDDLYKLERRITGINQKIHGIYNKQDANLIQLYAIGRLVYMFRKWIPAAIDRRFMNLQYNYDTDEWKEGYYRTTYNFIKELWQQREGLKIELVTKWDALSIEQRNNIIRALAESIQFLLILLVQKIISIDDDDADKQSLAYSTLFYHTVRASSEFAALTPVSILYLEQNMLSEFLKWFKSPIAAVNTAQDGYSILALLNPWCYFEEVKSGKFAGHSKAYKIVMSNRWWNPLGMVVDKNLHPENYIGFYK